MEELYTSSSDKKILLELFSYRKPLNIYYFHEKYFFSPAQINRFLRTYTKEKIVKFINNEVHLTDFGIKWIVKNRKNIFLTTKSNQWVKIPEEWKIREGK